MTVRDMLEAHPRSTVLDRDLRCAASTSASTARRRVRAAPTPTSQSQTWRSWSAAFDSASTAPTPARPPAASSSGRPSLTSASSARRPRPARQPVGRAPRSARSMPPTTSTAASAARSAAVVNGPAKTCSQRFEIRRPARPQSALMARSPPRERGRRRFTGRTCDAPGKIRTCDLCLRRAALYPLSYGRGGPSVAAPRRRQW